MASYEYKLILLGAPAVGKSALVVQLVSHNFVREYESTTEDSYRKQATIDEDSCSLEVVDMGGKKVSPFRDQEIQTASGILLIFSVTSRSSFEAAWAWKEAVDRLVQPYFIPFILVGNKADLSQRQVDSREAFELASSWGVPYVETSAKTRINVDEAFFGLVREIRRLRQPEGMTPTGPAKKSLMKKLGERVLETSATIVKNINQNF